MKPRLRVTRNSFLGNYYAKRIKANGSFSVFFFCPLRTRQRHGSKRWTLFLRLHYPCRWHITSFSLLAQVQSSRSLIKPKLPDYFLFLPTIEEKERERERERASMNLDLAENSNGHERNSCYRAITVLGLSTDGNAPLGNFPRQVFPGQEGSFVGNVSGERNNFCDISHKKIQQKLIQWNLSQYNISIYCNIFHFSF